MPSRSQRVFLLAFLVCLACNSAPEASAAPPSPAPAQEPPKTSQPAAPPAPPERELVSREGRAMGTVWKMSALAAQARTREALLVLDAAMQEVARLEALLSEWQPDSEISRVNANAGREPVVVGEELLRCVEVGQEIARWSDGAFDISWAALHGVWDFSATSTHVPPSAAEIKKRLPLWNFHNVVLDRDKHTVFLRKKGMAIGLGGIAKGYALDRAADMLHAAGFNDFLLFGGGQVRVGGQHGDRPWRVGIQHPRNDSYFAFVEVSGDYSVSTSGDYEHWYEHEGKRYHHILNPKTGFPSEQSASVTVVSPSALWADAVDTALFIVGPEKSLKLITSAPGGPHDAVFVDPSLAVFTTPEMAKKLIWRTTLVNGNHLP
jgi:thiamine biosynthesis lipoprotein